ncbi:hypothetical protein [Paludisphaera borealis]|uniref:Uncharacterized protein n=1 Tax=Paludisphaera borealis TaxID=1387353 RepID=A0A1U7CQG1_9BACT|nr:hypothetical protein [Paludisphaera borealis]APW61113.1 hypothetical protein BSF38_02617 [Paludisphaera borealis]
MRFPTRFGPGLLAMALAAPLTASAVAQQAGGYAPSAPIILNQAPEGYQQGMEAVAPAPAAKHNHKGLLGWRHCTECQRARAKAESGVDVPPPPSAAPQGRVVHQGHNHGNQAIGSTGCAACEAGAVVVGPVTVTEADAYPAGHAVASGEMMASGMPAGHAVVGGPDPAPVGVSRSSQGNLTPFNAMAAGGPRPGQRDPSVMPTSMIPAQTALGGPVGGRPRIISHLLGLPDLRRLHRDSNAYKSREGHAMISYEDGAGPVTELPASMVYDKGR